MRSLHNFGWSVALSGDAAVVGSPGDDGGGSALVFRFDGRSWTEQSHLLASDGEPGDALGDSVSIDGNLIAVGAPSDTNNNGVNAGAAYVYRFDGAAWMEEAKLVATDGAPQDKLGTWVAIDGGVAILGADGDDDNGGDAGSAYVFAGLNGVDCNGNGVSDACDIVVGSSRDADGNGVPDECDCPWDLDLDRIVGAADLRLLLSAWDDSVRGAPDFDADGAVGMTDLLELLSHWGTCPSGRQALVTSAPGGER